jgi:hypothetical protein
MDKDFISESQQAWLVDRFRELLTGDELGDDEKSDLSRKILQILHDDSLDDEAERDDFIPTVRSFFHCL